MGFDPVSYIIGKKSGGEGSTIVAKTITANGTYNASSDNADGYSPVIVNVSGGGSSVSPKQVNFIDYDGSILYAYTAQEAQALEALPANPSHSGLTAQGWNWTLAQIKACLTAIPDGPVWVGQMYVTQSGDTELDVLMHDGRLNPILTIAVNGTITVDWGDNTTPDTVTGSSLMTIQAVPHSYVSPGEYMMKIHVLSGEFTFYGSTSYKILRKNTNSNENAVYSNCLQAVRLGNGITSIGDYAFEGCYSLTTITLPSTVTSIRNYAFQNCYSFTAITLPSGITSIGYYAFQNCYSFAAISLPSGITSISDGAFQSCYSFTAITLPSGITSIGHYAFQSCYSFATITLPSGITSIGDYAFLSCDSLATITIPSTVTSIGNYAFRNCYGIAEYHVMPTSPPTVGNSCFYGIVSDCIIYVPASSLEDYKAASGWSSYSNSMQGE